MWRNSEAGFTLLEMMVTITVMGLVLAMLVPMLPPRSPRLETERAAAQLAEALCAARGQAIAQGVPVAFVLPALPRGLSAQLPAGGIVFAPDGSANGGAVRLAGPGGRLELRVDWLTGQAAVAAP